MIEAVKPHGREMAICTCDKCGAKIEFPAMHGSTQPDKTFRQRGQPFMKPSNVQRSIIGRGWAESKGRHLCKDCLMEAKNPKEKPAVTNVEPIRHPTREQKRQIIDMLTATYDIKAERYTGAETDITIADAIGGGCMFGWVAAIREDMFGPDGGNEERETLMAEITQWREKAEKLANDMHGALRDFNDARAKVADLQRRLDSVIKAAGPKAARA